MCTLLLLLLACDGGAPGDDTAPSEVDRDGDGVPAARDCDDDDPAVNPHVGADGCDGLDNDCDGATDEDPQWSWWGDGDGDGFGKPEDLYGLGCEAPAEGAVTNGADCDDTRGDVFPGAAEACDGADNDCDGTTDEGTSGDGTWYRDSDGDGYGDPAQTTGGCAPPRGYVDNAVDCDDASADDPSWVSTRGASIGQGSYTEPFDTIQAGIDRSRTCVYVEGGTYRERIDFRGKALLVWGIEGAGVTTLSAPDRSAGSLVTVASGEDTAMLAGFTVRDGGGNSTSWYDEASGVTYTSWYGGGVYVDGGSIVLSDVALVSNRLPARAEDELYHTFTYSLGGGLYVGYNSRVYLTDSLVAENYAYSGAGVYVGGNGELYALRARFWANEGDYGNVIGQSDGTVTVYNSLIQNNVDTTGLGGMYAAGSGARLTVNNSTFTDNVSAVTCANGAHCLLQNSIFAGNVVALYDPLLDAAWTLRYLDFYGNGWADWMTLPQDKEAPVGMLSGNPSFLSWSADGDPTNDDLHLASGSAAINAGDPARKWFDADGTRNDLGAYGGPEGAW